jgi:hypothetical protein
MAGTAVTVTTTLEDEVGSFTEAAVIIAVPVVPLAVNVADVVDTLVSVVQAAPEQVQVAPALVESCATVAVKLLCCPWSII